MTKIEWTDETWNPIVGCSKVSEGCENCYAERMACRLASMACSAKKKLLTPLKESEWAYVKAVRMMHDPKQERTYFEGWSGKTILVNSALEKPLHWKKPRRIFVCSMGDLFHESVPFEWIAKTIFSVGICFWHTVQILTKRVDRMGQFFGKWHNEQNRGFFFNPDFGPYVKYGATCNHRGELSERDFINLRNMQLHYDPDWKGENATTLGEAGYFLPWPLPNLHLGVTCENQKRADERIPKLLQIPAAVRFVSLEPLLGEIDLTHIRWAKIESKELTRLGCEECWSLNNALTSRPADELNLPKIGLDWVIIGCESLPGGRAGRFQEGFNKAAINIVEQCKAAGVPVFVKQVPINGRVVKDTTKFPKQLQVREYPKND